MWRVLTALAVEALASFVAHAAAALTVEDPPVDHKRFERQSSMVHDILGSSRCYLKVEILEKGKSREIACVWDNRVMRNASSQFLLGTHLSRLKGTTRLGLKAPLVTFVAAVIVRSMAGSVGPVVRWCTGRACRDRARWRWIRMPRFMC